MNNILTQKLFPLFMIAALLFTIVSSPPALSQTASSYAGETKAEAPTAESILLQVDSLIIEMADKCAQQFDFAFTRKYPETTVDFRVKKMMSAIALEGDEDTFGRQGKLSWAESAYRRHQNNEPAAYERLAGIVDIAINDPDYHDQAKSKFVGVLYQFHRHLRKTCSHLVDISYVRRFFLEGNSIFYGHEKARYEAIFEELVANASNTNQKMELTKTAPFSHKNRKLIDQYEELNSRCRGGSGDNPKTWEACKQRDALSKEMAAANLCYGKKGQAGYQMEWHHCSPNSLK